MRRIVCYPHSSIPSRFENDIDYFELFSRSSISGTNIRSLGLAMPHELRKFGIIPSIAELDFAAFSLAVVASDKFVSRSYSPDGWTRMMDLTIYLSEAEKWMSIKDKLEKMLRFLTGDFWSLTFLPTSAPPFRFNYQQIQRDNDCICLLSGGVDSLVGAIDLLSEHRNPLFVSQIIRGDGNRQRLLAAHFGENNHCQWSIGKLFGNEGSTRARSIAFFAFALLSSSSISALDGIKQIVVPENGFISLNVPLDSNRIGSLSTKTTHPVYMAMLQDVWDDLGIRAKLILPYKFKTKGEVLRDCLDRPLMESLIFGTNSCGKYQRHGLRHCGVCVPCLVRRASFLEAGLEDTTRGGYHYTDISTSNSKDVAAAALAIRQVELSGINFLVKGNLSFANGLERNAYLGVVSRGIDELNNLLRVYNIV